MRSFILSVIALLITSVSLAQQERELKLNMATNLIDVIYYHDNGAVSQTGSYTLEGKLQGEWLSFDTKGKKQVLATYDDGKKVGKWFYWTDKTLKEVDYTSNAIVSVHEWDSRKHLAIRN